MEESNECNVENAAIHLTEMMYLKKKQQSQEDAANSPCLGRQVMLADAAAHIRVGAYYEIDRSKLSKRTPHQLNSIRIIMVSKKSKYSVSLRFPSLYSLRSHFSERTNRRKPDERMLPELDEKHVMESELAGEVLYRRIPPHELAVKRNLWSFWVVVPSNMDDNEKISSPASNTRLCCVVSDQKDGCCSELKSTGMVKWGQRRQVQYLSRHVEVKERNLSVERIVSSSVKAEEERDNNEEEEEEEAEEEEVKDIQGSDDYEENIKGEDQSSGSTKKKNCKRKRNGSSRSSIQRAKRAKREKRNQITVCNQNTKKKAPKSFIDRWSVERYKLAEKNMLKVLKEKGAVFGNPILRPALRSEARRLIGDTGLLDHLLKHMAGKVAPGGQERFRRRHNADGAMEYWLESADLVNIRKEAGVQDPYWTPPPGWKPGDNPTQDPVCAREFKQLREEIAKLKGEMKEGLSKKQEEGLVIVTTPNSSVTSQTLDHDSLLLSLKKMYIDLLNKKTQIEEQLMKISQSVRRIEDELGRLGSTVEEPVTNGPESTETPLLLMGSTPSPLSNSERERKEVAQKNKEAEEQEKDRVGGKTPRPTSTTTIVAATPTENKAEKIVRLKSGFKICKPRGSFLWPNMVSPHDQVVVPIEDLLGVPTPTSVSSSTTSAAHLFSPSTEQPEAHPTPPVKPLAEKRPVLFTISTAVTTPPSFETKTHYESNSSNISINLNEVPNNQNDSGFCWSQSQSHSQNNTSASPLTYQRRHHNYNELQLPTAKKLDREMSQWEGDQGSERRNELLSNLEQQQQQQQKGCSSSASSSCLPVGVDTWLALASPNSSMDEKSRRG